MMIFITISALYVTCLALVDGLFNRLVFRNNRALPYHSRVKQEIFSRSEWQYIGLILLIVLPVIIPIIISYVIGGIQYVCVYLAVLMFIQWDVIFGKLVFDNWWGDTPSIALPWVGWISNDLRRVIVIRFIFFVIFGFIASRF